LSLETFVFFEKLRESISDRNLQRTAGYVKTPIPIFHPKGLKLALDQNDLFDILRSLFSGMNTLGVEKMFHSIDEISKHPNNSQISCLLTLRYADAQERQLCDSHLRFYLDRDGEDLKIVMVDYQKVAFQQIFEEGRSHEALRF